MNQLFPIIRRQRRPLLPVEDAPPMMIGNVEPPKVEAGSAQPNKTDATNGTTNKAQTDDEKVSTPE